MSKVRLIDANALKYYGNHIGDEYEDSHHADQWAYRSDIDNAPTIEPSELYNIDEWCTDCKEYDQERRCCPRWNRVIRSTIEESKAEAYAKGIDSERKRLLKTWGEPKQGEWIVLDTTTISIPVYWSKEEAEADEKGAGIKEHCECSACGWRTSFMGYKKLGVDKPFNFCPNCGARMKGADDE